ncbi:MAG: type III secretion system translocon subunit SctE [Planctomycetota bacterium]|jgi:hypothetical protein|nr:type III secretion system translocon subunit SctE [Planctomycetota bacterium]
MNPVWSNLTQTQQARFLQSAGLAQLPEPSALTDAQLTILVGIVGEETVAALRQAPAYSAGAPALDAPKGDTGDWSNIMAKVAELQLQLSELQQKVGMEGIKGQKDDIAKANQEEAAKIKERIEKLEKAAESGLLSKIFGWIGAVVAVIGAVIATAATGGAAAPALVVAVVGLTMMILQETGAMEKIIEELVKNPDILIALGAALQLLPGVGTAFGGVLIGLGAAIKSGALDEDKAKMAIQITMAAAMLVASIGGMVASGGAAATNVVAKIIGIVAQVTGALASVGGGAAGIAQATYSKDAADVQADQKEIQAWLMRLQQAFSEEVERLEEIISKLNSGMADISDVIGDIAKSNQTVISHMGA